MILCSAHAVRPLRKFSKVSWGKKFIVSLISKETFSVFILYYIGAKKYLFAVILIKTFVEEKANKWT